MDIVLNIMAGMMNDDCVHIRYLDALCPVLSCLVRAVDRFTSRL